MRHLLSQPDFPSKNTTLLPQEQLILHDFEGNQPETTDEARERQIAALLTTFER